MAGINSTIAVPGLRRILRRGHSTPTLIATGTQGCPNCSYSTAVLKYDSSDSDSDSNSFQDFNQINELSESLNSELESLNSDDDSSKSKIDPSLSNLV